MQVILKMQEKDGSDLLISASGIAYDKLYSTLLALFDMYG